MSGERDQQLQAAERVVEAARELLGRGIWWPDGHKYRALGTAVAAYEEHYAPAPAGDEQADGA